MATRASTPTRRQGWPRTCGRPSFDGEGVGARRPEDRAAEGAGCPGSARDVERDVVVLEDTLPAVEESRSRRRRDRELAVSTTARMTALSPGQSPPPVRIPMRMPHDRRRRRRSRPRRRVTPGLTGERRPALELEGGDEDAHRFASGRDEAADPGHAQVAGEERPAVACFPRVGELARAPRGPSGSRSPAASIATVSRDQSMSATSARGDR